MKILQGILFLQSKVPSSMNNLIPVITKDYQRKIELGKIIIKMSNKSTSYQALKSIA